MKEPCRADMLCRVYLKWMSNVSFWKDTVSLNCHEVIAGIQMRITLPWQARLIILL